MGQGSNTEVYRNCKLVVVERRKLSTVEDKWTAIKLIIYGSMVKKKIRKKEGHKD